MKKPENETTSQPFKGLGSLFKGLFPAKPEDLPSSATEGRPEPHPDLKQEVHAETRANAEVQRGREAALLQAEVRDNTEWIN
jgi:hypothetical protein